MTKTYFLTLKNMFYVILNMIGCVNMKEFIIKNKLLIIIMTTLSVITMGLLGFTIGIKLNIKGATVTHASLHEIGFKSDEILDELRVEAGSKPPLYTDYLTDEADKTKEYKITYYLDDKEVSIEDITYKKNNEYVLKGTNEYKILLSGPKDLYSTLKVIDNTKPVVKLKELVISSGDEYDAKKFINQYGDNTGTTDFTAMFKKEEYKSITSTGEHEIIIIVCDESNNCTEAKSKLRVLPKAIKYVKTIEKDIIVSSKEIKYGVRKVTTINVKYDVYSDGSTKEVNRGKEVEGIDQSKFNGTVKTMKEEMLASFKNYKINRETILKTTNEYRAEAGQDALVLDDTLSEMAQIRAMEIAYSGVFDHKRPDGREWSSLWKEYTGVVYSGTVGENLARGNTNATDLSICKNWKESKTHYANMVNSNFSKIGIGRYTFNGETYWVQLYN